MNQVLPGATLGILGGGQLGRMLAMEAIEQGYRVCVLDPDPQCPCALVAHQHLCAAYDDENALDEMASACDVITTEFENVPAQSLARLNDSPHQCTVHPSAEAIATTQDRHLEKQFILSNHLLPVPYVHVQKMADLSQCEAQISFPAILKTCRFGYDGKGQVLVASVDEAKAAFEQVGQVPCVLEQRIDLACEVSVVVAHNLAGDSHSFPVAENIHVNGILHQSIVPARVDAAIAGAARVAAEQLANALGFIGVMAVEFFVSRQGELFVNEIAPRTHNSGHYSQDSCDISQFGQQLRALCNLPLAAPQLLKPVVMLNLLGDVWLRHDDGQPQWHLIQQQPQHRLHIYGKQAAKKGRKMGHINTLAVDASTELEALLDESQQLFLSI